MEQSRAEQSRAEQSRAERLPEIDILKGIGIISVVIGHAVNTDNFYSVPAEYIRRFVYLYHLAVFFFCSGYLLRAKSLKNIILRFVKQYVMFLLICISSFVLIPLWLKTNIVEWIGIRGLLIKIKHILLFRLDGYFTGAMWFMPFMAIASALYSIILNIKEKSNILYYLVVFVSGVLGIILVSARGIGRYYIWLALLMIPIMAIGNEYDRIKGVVKHQRIPVFAVVFTMLLICIKGEIELSKGIIYGRIAFYPVILLGLLFCIQLKDSLLKISILSTIFELIGRNSMYIMGYHFIAFKIIDAIMSIFCKTSVEQLRLFPYSFPQCRVLYILGGLLIPCLIGLAISRINEYIKDRSGAQE